MYRNLYPFSAIVGQEELKQALLLNAVNPAIGGVLVRGEKGTAKSTAARALAELLPRINIVEGCPFSCDPDHPDEACDNCRRAVSPLPRDRRQARVVTLPLNATEDRVSGGVDFTLAIQEGRRALQPGLLAAANRGILYVDEVNLLDDHIVDIILDAAASGENIIEREGISFSHPARFILVGTMNPEEGELRPQFLDRFGLCVETAGAADAETRVALMERHQAFDADPSAFIQNWKEANQRVALQIQTGRERLPLVRMPRHLRSFITELCAESNVAGHRADLIMEQTARALAALNAAPEVTTAHISEIAPMVLMHRRREAQPPPPRPEEKEQEEEQQEPEQEEEDQQPSEAPEPPESEGEAEQAAGESPEEDQEPEPADESEEPAEQAPPRPEDENGEQLFQIGDTFRVKPITSARDRVFRRGSGRRSRTRVSRKQGRYVKSCLTPRHGDIALDATLRAAAPYQKQRGPANGLCVNLSKDDVRGKIREKRIGNFLLFAVDASGSMGARGRMAASKGAVMSLLLDAYQKRDRVGMISFRRSEATVNLPPSTSVDLASKLLEEMPVGGRTPLSAGLAKSFEQVRNILLKDPSARPIVILITDGKSNVALGDHKPVDEALRLAGAMSRDERIRYIVVDTEAPGLVTFELAGRLAAALDAQYFKIDDLKAQTLIDIVKGQSL
jgi:magnesium chelatase subunit D